jgi:hypothetical protein
MQFIQKFQVFPNQIGCLFYKSRLKAILEPGIYYYWDWLKEYQLLNISQTYRKNAVKPCSLGQGCKAQIYQKKTAEAS